MLRQSPLQRFQPLARRGVLLIGLTISLSCAPGPEALYDIGRLRHEEGELDLAIDAYRRAIAEDPSLAAVFLNLAEAYFERGDALEASLSCERALELDPGNVRASALLARAYLELGRAMEALPFALRGTQTPAPEPTALWTLGAVFLELKRYEDAERLYVMTISATRYPACGEASSRTNRNLTREDFGLLSLGLGLACSGQGKYDQAADWYDRALTYLPGHPDALYEKGLLLERSAKWRGALDCYKGAIRADPFFTEAQIRAGVALYHLGELLASRGYLLAARDDPSAGPEAPYTLGRIAEQRGFSYEALEYYREARAVDSSMAPAWLREGLLLRSLGSEQEGTLCLVKARQWGSSAARWILESEGLGRR